MKVNSVYKVCDFFMPAEKRPINRDFDFCGEMFFICTYQYMRGPLGLKGDETPNGYFIMCCSDWLDFRIDVYPERGEVRKRIGLSKKRSKRNQQMPENHERIMNEIEAAFFKAILG